MGQAQPGAVAQLAGLGGGAVDLQGAQGHGGVHVDRDRGDPPLGGHAVQGGQDHFGAVHREGGHQHRPAE